MSQKVLFDVNLTSMGKNEFGSAAGTTNSIDPLEQEANRMPLVVRTRQEDNNLNMKTGEVVKRLALCYLLFVLSINVMDHSKIEFLESYLKQHSRVHK